MIQELQLRILPEEAVSEQSLKQVVARETGTSVPYIHTVRVLKRSIDARQRTIYVNVKLRAFINEQPDEPEFQLVEYKDVSAGKPVVVVGAGPGGLFAALRLIELGLRPIVIERACAVPLSAACDERLMMRPFLPLFLRYGAAARQA